MNEYVNVVVDGENIFGFVPIITLNVVNEKLNES